MGGGIALDLSSKTGAAWGGPDDGRPRVALWRLPSIASRDTMDVAWAKLTLHLDELHALEKFEWMQIEAPLDTYRHTNGDTRKSADLAAGLIGLWAVACCWGQRQGIEVLDANVQTVRRHFIGHARPKDPKRAVMARCAQLGWRADDDNIADASALWAYEMSCRYPAWAPKATPLFAERSAA